MNDLRTNRIYDAIASLEHEAAFRRHIGGRSNLDHAKWLDLLREQATGQYRQLSDALPSLRSLSAEAERQYDRYVTREREPEGCSCHLSAPCSFCTQQADEDEGPAQAIEARQGEDAKTGFIRKDESAVHEVDAPNLNPDTSDRLGEG